MSVSCILIVNQNLCLPETPLEFHQGISHENLYENVRIKVAEILSVTNCWICSQAMLGGMGFPWRAHPVGWQNSVNGLWLRRESVKGQLQKTLLWNKRIQWSVLQDSVRFPFKRNQTLLWLEAKMWKDFYVLALLKMSIELGVLELVSVSVTPLPAAVPPFRELQQQPRGRVGAKRAFSTQRMPWISETKDSGSPCALCALPRPVEFTWTKS